MGVLETARNWLAHDIDDRDIAELTKLLELAETGSEAEKTSALAELADRFKAPLAFGTAGLRGEMGAGCNRMNTAVVVTAAAGICDVLLAEVGPGFKVVIGFDARHRSADFARATAAVVTAKGGQALLFDRYYPTPVTAFALRYLEADAGIMVTASHNPPADNGYKVYLGGRCLPDVGKDMQIVSPWDKRIQQAIANVGFADQVELAAEGWELIDPQVHEVYLARAAKLGGAVELNKDISIVLTSMHGVGAKTCVAALAAAGYHRVHQVASQADPDPDFPTVAFPNPEEPGAIDLALAEARQLGADILLANDPDADRCSAAIPLADGSWRQLTGDEIGCLLGWQVAKDYREANSEVVELGEAPALARSIVSGSMLDAIAADYGLRLAQTLTGFKWIARASGMIFGYEEAIGYCCSPADVADKDGISAAVALARLVAELKAVGVSIESHLAYLARRYGLYVTAPLTFRVEDLSLIAQGMANLRANGGPKTLAGQEVCELADLAEGWQGLPATDGLYYRTGRGDRVIVRPSGTEPKLKCYLETIVDLSECADDLAAGKQLADERIAQMKIDMTKALGF